MSRSRLFLVDSFGYLFRAYHARARSGAPPMRTAAGVPTEVVFIFHNMLKKLVATHSPEYLAAVFESEEPTHREAEFADYKANRPPAPEDFKVQVPWVRRMLEAMRIPVLEYPGYEADDVIGAIARRAAESGVDVTIVSSDKDMLQLVDERITMLNPAKDDLRFDSAAVVDFMGVKPTQVADLLALKGDAVDNIPGAPGIGEKGARSLIAEFGSVESAIERADEVARKSYRESLRNHSDQILLSKRLATIDTQVPIEWDLAKLAVREPDRGELNALYRQLEFFSLADDDPDRDTEQRVESDYATLTAEADVDEFLESISNADRVAVVVKPEGDLGELLIGLCAKRGVARTIGRDHLERVRGLLENPDRAKAALDIKPTLLAFSGLGVEAKGFVDDLTLYEFLLTADPATSTPEAVIARRLGAPAPTSVEGAADCTLDLAERLRSEVDSHGLRDVYEKIDLPLVPVLARMERTGIRIDPEELKELSRSMTDGIGQLTDTIHALAGKPFNINSPQQLSEILYDDLGLPAPPRSGKKKGRSTAAGVLESLASQHEIVQQVLEYRQLSKLKGTYVDALPALIDEADGRLHTTFNQCGAATGRLSSSNPNLQNIPIRTELGRQIRAAFVPEDGWKLLVADYSQLELRLVAHLSRDPVLVDAFARGEDIHTRTAAEIFGVAPLMVTPEMRRSAKAVNFGIVYGQSAFGLANQLGIPRQEADHYIRSYFERYRGVRKFIDHTIAEVRKSGVTKTLFGRERPIPDINSRNPNARGFAERTAVNTPLQGTGADLIKLAMIRIDRLLADEGLSGRMLLQVHDELVFETPAGEAGQLSTLVKREMENAHRLDVPLVVDIGIGDNWRDAK